MAYFQQYQTSPGWGTNQYQAMPPPAPSWQPQPGWGGMDYYRAYAGVADPFPYEYALNRVRNYMAEGGGGGTAGLVEAKMLYRQVYGGLGDIMVMPPNAIGAAAAYEVFRTWRYHYGIIARPLGGDRERQRDEALIGLAVGEAIRLWEYTHRFSDQTGRLATVESAAITAAQIFAQAQQMALVSGGIVGAGSVNGLGAESGMSSSGGGGYAGGMGAGGLSGGARMLGAGGMTSAGSGFPTPMGSSAGGMGVPGGGGGVGMGGRGMENGTYGAVGLAPPFRRQRSLSMGDATGLPGPMGMTNGIPPGIAGGAGYSRQGATAGGLVSGVSGVAGGMGAAGMGAAGMGGMGAGGMGTGGIIGSGGMGMGGMGSGGMQYAASQGSIPGGAGGGGGGGGGGAYGGGGLGITGLQRSRSYNTLNSGAGYPTEYNTGGAGYGGGVGGGRMYGGGVGGGPGGYGGGGYGGMNGGTTGMYGGGRGYGGIGTTSEMGLAGAVNGSYGAPAAAYAQGNLSPTGALGEEAIAYHERRREKRSNSGERRPRRRRHKHREGRTESTEGSNEGYGDNTEHGGGRLGCSAF